MNKFRRCFVPHHNFRFSAEPLKAIAEEIIYVCQGPMFDDQISDDFKWKFDDQINEAMKDFDPDNDIIAFYGDAIIFAMMVIRAVEQWEHVFVARYSSKLETYVVRQINTQDFSFGELEHE